MNINLIGPINKLGYGTHTINMLKAFEATDFDISLNPVGQVQEGCASMMINRRSSIPFDQTSPTIHIFHDEYLEQLKGLNDVIAFSVFETDKLSEKAAANLKQYAKLIFTTTEEHKTILKANGITKPIHVVHEGVDPDVFNVEPCEPLIKTNKYTYLVLGKNEKRKNTNLVMSAWIEEMQYKNVALICHTFNHQHKDQEDFHMNWYDTNLMALGYKMINETDKYYHFSNSFSDIYCTKPVLDTEEMKSLYLSANVGIAYSAGEGWGLPQIEMMACGKPVIISNVIGHKEYIKDLPVYRELIIEPDGKELAVDGVFFNGEKGNWYKMNRKPITAMLNYTFDNNIGKLLSPELSEYIIKNFNWNLAAQNIKQILEVEYGN